MSRQVVRFVTRVHGGNLDEVNDEAAKAVREFFGADMDFALSVEPGPTMSSAAGDAAVLYYEADVEVMLYEP